MIEVCFALVHFSGSVVMRFGKSDSCPPAGSLVPVLPVTFAFYQK